MLVRRKKNVGTGHVLYQQFPRVPANDQDLERTNALISID